MAAFLNIAKHSLEQLHLAIQEAFEFADDHLYSAELIISSHFFVVPRRFQDVRQEKGVSYNGCESRQIRSSQPSVASLEGHRVICAAKRRQQTNRPEAKAEAIEPRNTY